MAGIFGGLFDRGAAPATPAAPAAAAVDPAIAAAAAAEAGKPAAGSLESFQPMWAALDKSNAAPENQPLNLGVDATKLGAALKDSNLVGAIDPALMAAVAAGGEGAVQAMQAIQNATARNVLIQSTTANSKLIEAAIAEATQRLEAKFDKSSTSRSAQEQILAALPGLNTPAAAPLVDTIRAGIIASEPTLSATQVADKVKQYFVALSGVVTPQSSAGAAGGSRGAKDAGGETDWFARLGLSEK